MKYDGDSELAIGLLQRSQAGDRQAWGALVERYRDRLKLLVSVRMDRRVKQRLGESDVIQEIYLRLIHSAKLNVCAVPDERMGTMNEPTESLEEIDCLVEHYVEERRAGTCDSIEEFIRRNPLWARQFKKLMSKIHSDKLLEHSRLGEDATGTLHFPGFR